MSTDTTFIQNRWAATKPDAIQLYSFPTPNGIKVSAMLEETGLDYEAHKVSIMENDQFTPEFLSIAPNNKIPAIVDPKGPGDKPLALFESGAILVYLADKSGKFLSTDPAERYETLQWLMWQMGGAGPMFGQLGFFHKFAGKEIEDKRPLERFVGESKRLLGVLEHRLEGRTNIMGDEYTIADIALFPWVATLSRFYEAGEILEMDKLSNINRWVEASAMRPASQAAVNIPARG